MQGVLPARSDFVRDRARRGLHSIKLVIFDAHEGLKLVIGEVLRATRQRRRVSAMRNLLAYSGRQVRGVVAAFIGSAFTQEDATSANLQRRQVGDL